MSVPPDRPHAMVPLRVVDALLEALAGAIHDRPVQDLVAAKMMLNLVRRAPLDDEMAERCSEALTHAGGQARLIIWTLQQSDVGIETWQRDLTHRLVPNGDPSDPRSLAVTTDVDYDVDPRLLRHVLDAAHDVAAGAVLADQRVAGVAVVTGAATIEVRLHIDLITGASARARHSEPWRDLAAARMASLGGTVSEEESGDPHVLLVTLRAPRGDGRT